MTELLSALDPANGFSSAWHFLQQGGVFMVPLAITSVVGVMAVVFKALSLGANRVLPADLVGKVQDFESYESNGQSGPILQTFATGESVLARLCHLAVKHRGKPEERIVHVVESAAREESVHLQAGMGVLDVVVTVAPLLGLLGTASGLVTIFQGLAETSDNVTIARGISEALTTTIVGLAIAVPGVVAQSYFHRRIELFTARLETLLTDFAHHCAKPGPHSDTRP
ncbi:MAG: MotA/TolQ/ExbB proton channel family protein [Luteolibacter sp.]